jgi:hypothetical protein
VQAGAGVKPAAWAGAPAASAAKPAFGELPGLSREPRDRRRGLTGMFDAALRTEPLGRAGRWIAGIGLPVFFFVRLIGPEPHVIYVSWDPFIVQPNPIRFEAPGALALLVDSYSSTLTATAILAVWAAWRRWRASGSERVRPVWLPVCFLPTFVCGIEAVRHILAVSRCHGYVAGAVPNLPKEIGEAALTSGVAFAVTLIAGTIAACLSWSDRVRWRRLPALSAVLAAIALAVGGNWWLLWVIVQPLR